MSGHSISFSSRFLLLAALGFLASCLGPFSSRGAPSSSAVDSGAGAVTFAMGDLNGSWIGELSPNTPGAAARNCFLSVFDGAVLDAAEGSGGEWNQISAYQSLVFASTGALSLSLEDHFDGANLFLEGVMSPTLDRLTGHFSLQTESDDWIEGSFELRLGAGAGSFEIALLSGTWEGTGMNDAQRFRIVNFEADPTGTLLGAQMLRPFDESVQHNYPEAAVTFALADGSVGKIQGVILEADDGSQLSLRYLLINDTGTLLSGPGQDSVLGPGFLQLSR